MEAKSCPFRPRCGIHALRIPFVDLAFWDVFLTLVAGVVIWKLLEKKMPLVVVWLILFVIAICTHRVLGIPTRLNQFLFGCPRQKNIE